MEQCAHDLGTARVSRLACWLVLLSATVTSAQSSNSTIGSIERLSDKLDALVDADAKIEVLGEGYEWSEGPVWVPSEQCLLFSDIPNNVVHRWDAEGGVTEFLKPSGYTGQNPRRGESGSNGLTLDPQGRLLLCQHGDRRVARMDATWSKPAPAYITVADRYQGKRFNSPNDLALHSSGAIYFTDPPYGLEGQMDDAAKELPFQGVYRVDTDGNVRLLTSKLTRPNGIAFSPDESILYVAVSDPAGPIWMKYQVKTDGGLDDGELFFDASSLPGEDHGLPDGLKIDQHGNLFATGPGGVLIFSPQGEHLGTIRTTAATANCGFGEDGKSLFITADMYLLRVRLKTTGNGFR